MGSGEAELVVAMNSADDQAWSLRKDYNPLFSNQFK